MLSSAVLRFIAEDTLLIEYGDTLDDTLYHKVLTLDSALGNCPIASRFDRMAYQLRGVRLTCEQGHDILSDGVTMGAIQVPGDGRPFVLMADHQPTGGYPKIACICKADLPRLAQMAPGRHFSLHWTTPELAVQRWAAINQQLDTLTALRGV